LLLQIHFMQKLSTCFYLKKDKTKDGLFAIYAKIKLGGSSATFSTLRYISPERWKKTSHLLKAGRLDNELSLKNYIYEFPSVNRQHKVD